jgi:hypothetical protein
MRQINVQYVIFINRSHLFSPASEKNYGNRYEDKNKQIRIEIGFFKIIILKKIY